MKRILLTALATLALTGPVWAQSKCMPTSVLETQLKVRHGELKFSTGVTGTDITEVFVNPDSGTFTVVSRKVQNMSCIVTAGQRFRLFKHVSLDTDS